jgi:hypothetical protein
MKVSIYERKIAKRFIEQIDSPNFYSHNIQIQKNKLTRIYIKNKIIIPSIAKQIMPIIDSGFVDVGNLPDDLINYINLDNININLIRKEYYKYHYMINDINLQKINVSYEIMKDYLKDYELSDLPDEIQKKILDDLDDTVKYELNIC